MLGSCAQLRRLQHVGIGIFELFTKIKVKDLKFLHLKILELCQQLTRKPILSGIGGLMLKPTRLLPITVQRQPWE